MPVVLVSRGLDIDLGIALQAMHEQQSIFFHSLSRRGLALQSACNGSTMSIDHNSQRVFNSHFLSENESNFHRYPAPENLAAVGASEGLIRDNRWFVTLCPKEILTRGFFRRLTNTSSTWYAAFPGPASCSMHRRWFQQGLKSGNLEGSIDHFQQSVSQRPREVGWVPSFCVLHFLHTTTTQKDFNRPLLFGLSELDFDCSN